MEVNKTEGEGTMGETMNEESSKKLPTTILDEARECVAQSNLMFLYADLRLLSATGRINTKFETLCIDSDRVPRTTASQMAQLPEETSSRLTAISYDVNHGGRNENSRGSQSCNNEGLPYCEGVSPAQVMAILIVELRKEVVAYRKRVKAQIEKENEKGGILSSVVGTSIIPPFGFDDDDGNNTDSDDKDADDDDAGVMNTVTNGKGRKDFETGMHQMVRAHNDMLYKDLRGMPEVQVSKAVFQKPLKGLTKGRGGGGGGQYSNNNANSMATKARGIATATFGGLFSNDEGDNNNMDGSVNSKESWLGSLRKSSTLTRFSKEPPQVIDIDGDEIYCEGKPAVAPQQQPPIPTLATIVAAAKFLMRKPTSQQQQQPTTPQDMTIDVQTTDEEQQQQQQQQEEEEEEHQQVVQRHSNVSSTLGTGKQLSGIFETDEDDDLMSKSTSLRDGIGGKNEDGDHPPTTPPQDIFRDIGSTGNTPSPPLFDHRRQKHQSSPRSVTQRGIIQRGMTQRGNITKQLSTRINQYREDHALYNKGMVGFIPADDYDTFNGAENLGNQLMRMRNSILMNSGVAVPVELADSLSDQGRNMSEKELLDYMTKCIESREPDRLDFMADFFRENTVSQTMVKSKTRIVWLQDWFPIKDPIYGIAVDKEKRRVLVVFRGAITRPDWGHAFDHALVHTNNPVKDEYEGKTNTIKLHRGFYRYLLRTRKDTMTRKYDEIANKVYEYGSKMIGEDFTVTVNGYSLGGALSVLFGFYSSTDERFTKNGPVKIFTYGGPYVAGHTFADAFRHQEKLRKVQCARFYNSNDIGKYFHDNV
jgi:hypothetical protein